MSCQQSGRPVGCQASRRAKCSDNAHEKVVTQPFNESKQSELDLEVMVSSDVFYLFAVYFTMSFQYPILKDVE
jgi:hypothetical protein